MRFTVDSRHATAVELCLFEPGAATESRRLALERGAGDRWQVFAEGVGAGQLYGYRVHGPWAPAEGHRFNPAKLLVDPRARAVTGGDRWHGALLGFDEADPARPDPRDSAPWAARSVVVDPAFAWQEDRPPRTPWADTVIYEAHLRGLTRRHPRVPPELRGSFLGLCHPAVVQHLVELGVTAVELLPIQHFVAERHLAEHGRANYWGYSPVAWFAPHAGYAATGDPVRECKTMVCKLHRAGLEVILDVVYNHSGEGDATGPTLGLRGLDNRLYYRHRDGRYEDLTGCGNTLNLRRPAVHELVLDSLRYWVREMHVDGFRFDLAPALGRTEAGFDDAAPFFQAVAADPLLAGVKLIAEPWDLGPGGYRLGGFPSGWAEWNDRFRNTVRSFWRGDGGVADLATRLAGSRDRFARRSPQASVNYVTCHDGFTLADLVSYERKHNLANGEDNRDGTASNRSRNWGVEGPTEDPAILARRRRVQRSLLATLAFAQGVPMLGHGDELGRSQRGNNNPYCLDDETTWLDWDLTPSQRALLAFCRRVLALRRRYPVLRSPSFLGPDRLRWLDEEGRTLTADDWRDPHRTTLTLDLAGPPRLLLLLNGGEEDRRFRLPPGATYRLVVESAEGTRAEGQTVTASWTVASSSLVLLEEEAETTGS